MRSYILRFFFVYWIGVLDIGSEPGFHYIFGKQHRLGARNEAIRLWATPDYGV